MNRPDRVVHDVDKKAEELAKAKHNGVVRIRFEASYFDDRLHIWQISSRHSNSVHDQS